MKILFDQGTPAPLRRHLIDHEVLTAFECGWSQLKNGELLNEAEELLVTTDRNLRYQQNLTHRKIAILVLMSTSWPRIQARLLEIQSTVGAIQGADYVEVAI